MKKTLNNCALPLILTLDADGYKVNKLYDQSGEYVDKKIADELLAALKLAVEIFEDAIIKIDDLTLIKIISAIAHATAVEPSKELEAYKKYLSELEQGSKIIYDASSDIFGSAEMLHGDHIGKEHAELYGRIRLLIKLTKEKIAELENH